VRLSLFGTSTTNSPIILAPDGVEREVGSSGMAICRGNPSRVR
jgi:hypothetical protein